MSKRAIAGALLIAATAVSAGESAPPSPAAKPHALLQIKPGLWEFTDRATVSGDSVFPETLLAGIPAAQRARRLAQLREMIAQPGRERECMTQASFDQRLFGIESGCNRTIVSNSAARTEVVTECRTQSGSLKQDKKARILATSPTAATMSFHAISTQNGKTMIVDSVENGHWLASTCGSVHGIEQLR